jgi:hypothetical protein
VTQLIGTGLLADDLYLLAHHDVTGRPFLRSRALGSGLAGGLLAELMFAGAVRASRGRVAITGRAWAGNGLGRSVLSLLATEREPRLLEEWLAVLGADAPGHVARRLESAGYLTLTGARRLRREPRWVPVSSDCAFAPLGRMRAVLDPARMAAVPDITLAGLAVACGLGTRLLPYGPPGARRHLDAALRQLGPDLRELIGQVQAAADVAVLSHRA